MGDKPAGVTASLCDFDGETMKCQRCGYLANRLPTYRVCRTIPEMAENYLRESATRRVRIKPIMLGDGVKAALSAVGITEKTFAKMTGKEDCGCSKRRAMLNSVGAAISDRLEKVANAVLNTALPVSYTPEEVASVAEAIAKNKSTNRGLVGENSSIAT